MDHKDADANASSCLLSDFCDHWRAANGLTDADYFGTEVRKLYCPHFRGNDDDRSHSAENYRLRYCYAYGENGWRLVYTEAKRTEQLLLPLPEEGDFNGTIS
jgi:hypothetical protein